MVLKAQSAQKKSTSPPFLEQFTYDAAWMYAPPKIVKPITLVAPPVDMPLDNTLLDQIFSDDVIINGGSLCVGLDCVNGENFGFDTGRYKENNLRIHFDDTSSSASFPSNDWRIVINDSSNGGNNYFAVEDATAGRQTFRVDAGAPANSLYVDSNGDVGFGTNNPIVETHVADGDTPTLRLEQNGTSGFTPQAWDIAGNETNFFVRDVTNGSSLPFRIRPGAPQSSIDIASNGNIGIGTENPDEKLHIKNGSIKFENSVSTVNGIFGDGITRMRYSTSSTPQLSSSFIVLFGEETFSGGDLSRTGEIALSGNYIKASVNNTNGSFGDLAFELKSNKDLYAYTENTLKQGNSNWTIISDRNLKTDIRDYNDGLDKIMKINPVWYRYNGEARTTADTEHVGVIAQELKEIAPYTIGKYLYEDKEKNIKEDYLSVNDSSIKYMLVNAVQEQQQVIEAQQKEIDELKATVSKLQDLETQIAQLRQMIEQKN